MAYIPPHKRHPAPTANTRKRYIQNSHYTSERVILSKDSIARWFLFPSDHDDQDGGNVSVTLKEFHWNCVEWHVNKRPAILVCSQQDHKGWKNKNLKAPWDSLMEKLEQDLLAGFQDARNVMCKDGNNVQYEPHFVIRLGKVLFYDVDPLSYIGNNGGKSCVVENDLIQSRRAFYTNIPKSFQDDILGHVAASLESGEVEEFYDVKVFVKSQPSTTIVCKCTVNESLGELEIYKILLNQTRHMVADISCLDKNLDLRMILASQCFCRSPTDDEKLSLNGLVKSAVINPKVWGGLEWPQGKESVDDRYFVVGSARTKIQYFDNSFMGVKIREASRYDFRTCKGEITREISLRMVEIDKQLNDTTLPLIPLIQMVRDALKLTWENFLCWEGTST